MLVVVVESSWYFMDVVCESCGKSQLVTDQFHWPLCPECGWRPPRTRIEPQPKLSDLGVWWYEVSPYFHQPFFDDEQMESYLFNEVFGNSEIDVDMFPVLDNGVWYWERKTAEQ